MRQIRLATPADAAACLAVYQPFLATPITFEEALPSAAAFAGRIGQTLQTYPYLVLEVAGQVAAYAYAGPLASRAAYRWSAELSVYVAAAWQKQGFGKALYGALLPLLRQQGVQEVFACITLPNPASLRLHQFWGFTEAGLFRQAGYKCGRWHDVAWLQKSLAEPATPPPELTPITAIPAAQQQQIFARALQYAAKPANQQPFTHKSAGDG